MRLLTILTLTFLMLGCNKPTTFEEAELLYQSGDIDGSVQAFTPLAESGDYRAQLRLGLTFLQEGQLQDLQKSASYFKRAAEQGDIDALWHVGHRYLYGKGVPQNEAIAEKYLMRAAAGGNPRAMWSLGHLYSKRATTKPQSGAALIAKEWFKKAFLAGDRSGAVHIWGLYATGAITDPIEYAAWMHTSDLTSDKPSGLDPFRSLSESERTEALVRSYKYYGEFATRLPPATFLNPAKDT